jgi:exopolysaccharide biosynthesis polyprenyl glycosylphosphotransferase
VSIAAIPQQPSFETPTCAARLIPGRRRAPSTAIRKRPQSVPANDRAKTADSEPAALRHTRIASIASAILPTPSALDDPWEFWCALLSDHGLILASWAGAAGIAAAMGEGFLPFRSPVLPAAKGFVLGAGGSGLLFAVIATLFGYSEGLYERGLTLRRRAALLAKSIGWTTILLGAALYSLESPAPAFGRLTLSAVLSFGSLLAQRSWREHTRYVDTAHHEHTRNVLIVGAGTPGRKVAAYLERHPELKRVVRGFLDDSSVPAFGVLGPPEKLATIARAQFVDEVILADPHRHDLAQLVLREARRNHLDVKAVPDFCGCELQHPRIENLGGISLVTLHQEKLPTAGLFLKRTLDILLSSLCLLLAAPLLLLVAGIIKLDSKGSVLYGAFRVGRKGRRFRCFKFRTMVANASATKEALRARNQREGPCFKIAEDPRITRVGKWLRRYSLDELPQLWNVWKGEMSMVGPRPHPLDDFARYQLEHFRRLDVTPGITGLWQVTARHSPSFQTNMALDLEYIERWSLWMDLRILLKTISIVLQGTGT